MKNKKQVKQKDAANVEFGIEFGDLNAAKMYERPFPARKQNKNKNKKS